ncbi:CotH kinase family protein [Dokdonia sp. Hel_I_53]|uniref:CotH kinase family protein n=1 Tax=Dokdonia sp. Hel_I_53 TaxID=1566287 RepID=UPI00119A23BB|nr:CotH kinase family protein [Dokdonia sp. Hel_I_53]TVZ52953.1 CotH protein [Dokdonia sp. Hel_I_53]
MKYYLLLCACFFTLISCAQVNLTSETVALDDSLKIAVIQIPESISLDKETSFTLGNSNYTLVLESKKNIYEASHILSSSTKTYKAFITSLPLIQIDAPDGIVNEPKRMSQISYAYKDTTLTSYAGIELRGSSSIAFPKKTYDINFYKDGDAKENQDFKLAGMRSDDDWILDGLYNEPLRMRSYLSLNLWNDIYKPHYLEKEPKAKAGATGKYAEVFVNNNYQGLFLLQEQVDRKLVKVKKIKGDTIRGEIFQGARYLGASSFDSIPVKKNYLASWGGYDIKYPTPTNHYWDNVYPFTKFVIESDDITFSREIKDKFVINNAIDYFLYINALRAPDNLGKNLYLIRYDAGEPYFYAPWDLDGSFGTIFSGKRIPTTEDFLSNGLLRRLITTDADGFISKFQERWKTLRATEFSEKNLLEKQRKTYFSLKENLIFEREALAWGDFIYDEEGLAYMQDWTKKRLLFLDDYIDALKK